ncbi:MAG: bile acid:sodium symporter [Thermodesulfobacteriota bacterium]
MDGVVLQWIVPAAMFGVMLGMGLTLGPEDFRRIALLPGPTALGTVLQLVAMPLAGLALARGFALEPLLAAGLVVIAACPGGVMSNVLCHLGKADTALSITLTALATTVTLLTIPLWVRASVAGMVDAGPSVEMPLLETALDLGAFTVLPVALGMVVRPWWPALAAREAWLTRASTAAIIVALTIEALRSEDPPVAALAASWTPSLVLLAIAFALGVGVPLALGLAWRDAATIAVELCIKNSVLGLFVATESLGSLDAAVPTAVFMTFQMPAALGALALYHLAERRRLQERARSSSSTSTRTRTS